MNYAVLINKDHPIKDNYYKYVDMVNYVDIYNNKILIERETLKAYLLLVDFLKSKNIDIGIESCYRNFDEQKDIYDKFVEKYGVNYSDGVVAPIGSSEHHSGLAIDISIKILDCYLTDNECLMENEDIFLEIHKYLSDFGFILRYPKGKENITGYSYEPWHIRYVGVVVSKIIYNNNWTLEEYLDKFNGVLVVNKKKGMTSFDVVNEISHIFGIKKVGHTGTLDPMAEGVLVVAIGKATKIVELLTSLDKEYRAGAILGILTDTLDITGKVIDTKSVDLSLDLERIVLDFKKTYMQEVPNYSAVKVDGKKLYEYARKNEKVVLPKKQVTIYDIDVISSDNDTFMFDCCVSKGCYIRSLIRDIGYSMDTYATMTKLTRMRQGKFLISDAYYLEDIKNNNYKILSIEESLDYTTISLDSLMSKKVKNGVKIKNIYNIKDKVIFKDNNGLLIGIYEVFGDYLKTWKNF